MPRMACPWAKWTWEARNDSCHLKNLREVNTCVGAGAFVLSSHCVDLGMRRFSIPVPPSSESSVWLSLFPGLCPSHPKGLALRSLDVVQSVCVFLPDTASFLEVILFICACRRPAKRLGVLFCHYFLGQAGDCPSLYCYGLGSSVVPHSTRKICAFWVSLKVFVPSLQGNLLGHMCALAKFWTIDIFYTFWMQGFAGDLLSSSVPSLGALGCCIFFLWLPTMRHYF